MPTYLDLSVQFLDPIPSFHGCGDGGEAEWPPSPLRLFQALLCGASARWRTAQFGETAAPAIKWLEGRTPEVVAPPVRVSRTPYRMYVPNNVGDLTVAAWARGTSEASIAEHRVEKDVRPTWLQVDEAESVTIHYLYSLSESHFPHLTTLKAAARSITHLGWGLDMATGNAAVLSEEEAALLPGERWRPADDFGRNGLRVPVAGTLEALVRKHGAFLNRIGRDSLGNEFSNPVPPLSAFRAVGYRRATDPPRRPFIVFELRNDDDTRFSYPQERLIHLTGMLRHLAIKLMTDLPPGRRWQLGRLVAHIRRWPS